MLDLTQPAGGWSGPAETATSLITPHGGRLVDRWVHGTQAERLKQEAAGGPRLRLDRRAQSDFELLATGAFSPLTGFVGREDLESILHRSRLASGFVWPIPVVLAVDDATARRLPGPGVPITLEDDRGVALGTLDLSEKYRHDREEYARNVYGTLDPAHPGVARVLEAGEWHLAGAITAFRRPDTIEFPDYHLDPADTRALIRMRGWRTVVGFQTRNPIHRAHEFILKSALEIFDALLVQPLVGETRPGDVPAGIRIRCCEVLLEHYYPKHRTLLAVLPAAMRFAGPREAVFHALVRRNYGCTHFIVGRDHAGVGNFYGPYDAQRFFDRFPPEDLGIVPLRFENSFYCGACGSMASLKTCPHPVERHLSLSGTRVREMLSRREALPVEFTRPEVAQVLMDLFAPPLTPEVIS
jgi:sulfate adenylyltransferase